MFGLGFGELIVIFMIALIFIGPKKLPELAKGIGKAVRQFQDAAKGITDQLQDVNNSVQDETKKIADAVRQDEPTPPASNLDDKDKPQS